MINNRNWRWYITIAAVRQLMQLAGLSGEMENTNPDFLAAQDALGELSMKATLAVEASEKLRGGGSIYRGRVMLGGKSWRLEATVMPSVRAEGSLPQLVRVTHK